MRSAHAAASCRSCALVSPACERAPSRTLRPRLCCLMLTCPRSCALAQHGPATAPSRASVAPSKCTIELASCPTRSLINCEDDKSRTREGRCTLSGYSFLHQVYGEVSLCERVLKPNGSMFAERIRCGPCLPTSISKPSTASSFSLTSSAGSDAMQVRMSGIIISMASPTRSSATCRGRLRISSRWSVGCRQPRSTSCATMTRTYPESSRYLFLGWEGFR